MLGTRERALLLDSLRPPAGYHLRRAVGTSFTLDLMALLTAPLAFSFFDAHDDEGAPVTDPVALLEALRRHAGRITLFCQAGAISVPAPDQKLLAFLEGSVIEVQPRREGGIFHPKVWVLAFESEAGPTIYRVLCLSRNLTFARAWDTCLRLEGRRTEGQGEFARNEPFAELLLALPELTIRPVSTELGEHLRQMADEIRNVNFAPPRPFSDFRVHNFGLGDKGDWPFPKGGRSLVVSPFLVGSTVRSLGRDHGLEVLISRTEAFEDVLRAAGREALPETCYVLSPGASLDARDTKEEGAKDEKPTDPSPVEGEIELAGLHAKLFLFENGRHARLFVGSANATGAAFHQNVEVLVELVGKTKDCGIGSLLGSEADPMTRTLRSLLQEYTPPPNPEPEPDARQKLEKRAERLAHVFGAARLTATVDDVDAEQRWDMTLSGELPEIPPGATVKVWPAALSAEAALLVDGPAVDPREPDDPSEPNDVIATFKEVSFEALTAFFAFEVSLREGRHKVRQRFAVTAELRGAPEDRKERVVRLILKNRRRVLQLLFLILMGEGADVSALVPAARRDSTVSRQPLGGWNRSTLLEALLGSLSRNPGQIDDAARLIRDLRKTAEGKDLLPEGLDEIWEPIWAARRALKS